MNSPTTDEPFGRQPQSIRITITGNLPDVNRVTYELKRFLGRSDDNVDALLKETTTTLIIYPRAVND